VRGGREGPSHLSIFIDWPARDFSCAVRESHREEFWSRHEKESEIRTIRNAAESPRACGRQFDFKAGFYALFHFLLIHHLDSILNFRDDFSWAAGARGLTTWTSFTVRGRLLRSGPRDLPSCKTDFYRPAILTAIAGPALKNEF